MPKVFVTGDFHILHSGHVLFLKHAADHGDLYVGISSNSTLSDVKGVCVTTTEEERLLMVKSLACVKDAWINTGCGNTDFIDNMLRLQPDIFYTTSDSCTDEIREACKEHNVELVVEDFCLPENIPARSDSDLLCQFSQMPYRIEIFGGMTKSIGNSWGIPVCEVVASINPIKSYSIRSGLSSDTRYTAIKMWDGVVPKEDQLNMGLELHKKAIETFEIGDSADALGIVLPGITMFKFLGYVPEPIDPKYVTDLDIIQFVEDHLFLYHLPPRPNNFNPWFTYVKDLDYTIALQLYVEQGWKAILNKNIKLWIKSTKLYFNCILKMLPEMMPSDPESALFVRKLMNDPNLGVKFTGAGGGGYLIVVAENKPDFPVERISIRRK